MGDYVKDQGFVLKLWDEKISVDEVIVTEGSSEDRKRKM